MVTVLSAGRARLILEPDESDWCQVIFDVDGRRVDLGADARHVIVERLGRAVLDELEGSTVGVLDGVEVRGVLSLAERHSTLFAGNESGWRVLFIQAEDGSLLGRIVLEHDEMRTWRGQLDRARTA